MRDLVSVRLDGVLVVSWASPSESEGRKCPEGRWVEGGWSRADKMTESADVDCDFLCIIAIGLALWRADRSERIPTLR